MSPALHADADGGIFSCIPTEAVAVATPEWVGALSVEIAIIEQQIFFPLKSYPCS